MKTPIKSTVHIVACALAATFVSMAPEAMAGPDTRIFQMPIQTQEEAAALKPGQQIAMSCAKCKTVQIMNTDKKRGFLAWFSPKTKHLCPGCGGSIEYKSIGGGKENVTTFVHSCSQCGDKSVSCCATGSVTKGM